MNTRVWWDWDDDAVRGLDVHTETDRLLRVPVELSHRMFALVAGEMFPVTRDRPD